jgi:hypothetical protein
VIPLTPIRFGMAFAGGETPYSDGDLIDAVGQL